MTSSTSRAQFIFLMFSGLKCLQVKINFSNLRISFSPYERFDVFCALKGSRSTDAMLATRSKFMGRPKLDMSHFIDSNFDLFIYLIEKIRFST